MSDASAGTQLRTARDALGLSLSALAASLKVGQSKLEALEADRIDLLPDATFARALAQTVCRALKIDPQPVLAALPAGSGYRLEQLGEGINTPFRDHGDRSLGRPTGRGGSVWIWAAGAVAIATALVLLVPTAWWSTLRSERTDGMPPAAASSSVVSAAPGAQAPADGAPDLPEPDLAASAPPSVVTGGLDNGGTGASSTQPPTASPAPTLAHTPPVAAVGATASSGPADAPLRLQARTSSWVEVVDAQGRTLISRTLAAGEQVALDGSAPLRLKIGNAVGTQVVYRGAPVDLSSTTKDNVARLELAR